MSDHLQVWDATNNLLFFVYALELRGTIHSDNFHVNLVVMSGHLRMVQLKLIWLAPCKKIIPGEEGLHPLWQATVGQLGVAKVEGELTGEGNVIVSINSACRQLYSLSETIIHVYINFGRKHGQMVTVLCLHCGSPAFKLHFCHLLGLSLVVPSPNSHPRL